MYISLFLSLSLSLSLCVYIYIYIYGPPGGKRLAGIPGRPMIRPSSSNDDETFQTEICGAGDLMDMSVSLMRLMDELACIICVEAPRSPA